MTLFDFIEYEQEKAGKSEELHTAESLSSYAFLYTATATGKNSGIHFMMTVQDAMKWCESDISCGIYLGNRWAYFFTSVQNFITCHWGCTNHILDFSKSKDNGMWDKQISDLGLKKYGFKEIRDILTPLGVEVIL